VECDYHPDSKRKGLVERDISMNKANRLREIRRELGIPLQGLAALASVSSATLVQIENWGYMPGSEVRERIASTLSVPQDTIWPELATQAKPNAGGLDVAKAGQEANDATSR
jgi:DNA-binding XRE family transcriptional regulator